MAGLLSAAGSMLTQLSDKTATAYLAQLTSNGSLKPGSGTAFQYFPASISDSKANNWTTKDIPGGSLPLYNWVSGGARAIGFTAYFTTDVDIAHPGRKGDSGGQAYLDRLKQFGEDRRNIDIRAAIAWLRQYMLPTYGTLSIVGTPVAKSPQPVLLCLPGTGIGVTGGDNFRLVDEDTIPAIMQTCDVTYEAAFPSGTPRIAQVSLSFEQIAQMPGMILFPSADRVAKAAVGDSSEPFFAYKMAVRPSTMKRNGS